jgi:hypothetical protein
LWLELHSNRPIGQDYMMDICLVAAFFCLQKRNGLKNLFFVWSIDWQKESCYAGSNNGP